MAAIGDELDDTEAAALGVPVFTALMCLERAQAAGASLEGAHVLVTGATGAVGTIAVQLAKLMGAARVVAAGRDSERLERALSLGADAAVELRDGLGAAELRDRISEAAGERLDVALDPLWGEPARAAMEALTRDGVYVSFGQAASPVAELSGIPMRNRRITVVGHSGAWATPAERQEALARAHALAERGGRRLSLDTEELALEEIGDGWERLSQVRGPQAGGEAVTTSTETLPYPRFSDGEMARRRDALAAELEAAGAGHALLYGANRAGPAVGWLTRWPVTREALCVFTPGERDLLLVNFYNHLPNAERIATEADVRWAGPKPMATALEELERRGARGGRVAVIGPLGYRPHTALAEFASPVPLDDAYTRLRLRKSPEELDWLRIGCEFTDSAVRAVHLQAWPGTDERELGNIAERAYVGRGGTTHIHYFGVPVPAQWPAARTIERGDVLSCEISASYWDYTGQLLRTFTVADEPAPLYRELHDVADAAFDALFERVRPGATAHELVEASARDRGCRLHDAR